MSNTALILRPADAPNIHVLECDGPYGGVVSVNRYPGGYSGSHLLSFEEFKALPDYARFIGPSLADIEFKSVQRIYRLIKKAERGFGFLGDEHLREIRGRLKVLFPFCDEEF